MTSLFPLLKWKNKKDIIEALEKGANPNETRLFVSILAQACKESSTIAFELLERGADPDGIGIEKKSKTRSPIAIALKEKRVALLHQLLLHGADHKHLFSKKQSILHTLFDIKKSNDTDLIEKNIHLLIDRGEDLCVKNENGKTILMRAIGARSNFELLEKIVSRNCDMEHVNEEGQSALIIALDMSQINVVKWLLSKGADERPALEWLEKDRDYINPNFFQSLNSLILNTHLERRTASPSGKQQKPIRL